MTSGSGLALGLVPRVRSGGISYPRAAQHPYARFMYDNPRRAPRLSPDAMRLMDLLVCRGGSTRITPLLQACVMSADHLAEAINELAERHWIDIVWLGPAA
jgi:hypothetical protein